MSHQTISAGAPVKSVAFSPDDSTIAALTPEGITFFDAPSGARVRHVDAALTRKGLEELLWIRPELLIAWHFAAIRIVTLVGDGIDVKDVPCARVRAVESSPEGDALLVVDGGEPEARVVTIATLESRKLRKLDECPVAAWAKEGIALASQVDGKPGKAELLSPEGDSLIKMPTPRGEQVSAVGVIEGALAAVVANQEIHRLRAGEKKPTVTTVTADVDPALLRPDVGLGVFCDEVCALPSGKSLGTLPEGWLTTLLSHDGRWALMSDPDRADFLLAEVPQPKVGGKKKAPKEKAAAPRPGLDGRAWALVVYGVAVDGIDGAQVAGLCEDIAAAGPGVTAAIDGMVEDDLFERVFAGVVVASTSKEPTQRATAPAVEIGEPERAAAKARFEALRAPIVAVLARHDLEVEQEPGFWLVQAGPNASATLAAKKGGALRAIQDEDEDGGEAKAKKKIGVSYDATLSTRVEIEGAATLTVTYL